MKTKVASWVEELECLSSIATVAMDKRHSGTTQPHAAFTAFTHGLTSRWTYLARTTPQIEDLLKPLEEAIRSVST